MASLTAGDIMTADPVTVTPETSVTEASKLIVERSVGSLPVLEGDDLVGIVTETDLIGPDVKIHFPTYIDLLSGILLYPPSVRKFEREIEKAVGAKVADIMTREPASVTVDTTVEDVATLMTERDVSRVPVLDGGKLVGVISKSDIVRSLVSEG